MPIRVIGWEDETFELPDEILTTLDGRYSGGMVARGAWDGGAVYAIGDTVSYEGSLYVCKTAIAVPSVFNAADWDLLYEGSAGGGGGTVQVVTGITPPATPAVNIIWIDTSGVPA